MPPYLSWLFSGAAGSTEGSNENSVSHHLCHCTLWVQLLHTAGFYPVENCVLIFPCLIIDCYIRTDSTTKGESSQQQDVLLVPLLAAAGPHCLYITTGLLRDIAAWHGVSRDVLTKCWLVLLWDYPAHAGTVAGQSQAPCGLSPAEFKVAELLSCMQCGWR